MANTSAIDLTQPQLLLTDDGLADTFRVHRQWHQPRKYPQPVLVAEHPWEFNCPVAYGSVLHREGKFHIWYCGWTKHTPARVLHAVSDDGVHWTKPALGLFPYEGDPANNIVLESDKPGHIIDDLTVIEDDRDAKWPLKMLYWDGAVHGICLARSADGIHWDKQGVVLPQWGDRFNAVACRYRGEFIALARTPDYWPAHRLRVVHRTASRDLKRWSKPTLALKPDSEDPPLMEIYSLAPFEYAGRLLGTIERMHMRPDKLDNELAWSDDAGVTWQRSRPREPFIPLGPQGHFDDTWLNLTANGPIVVKDQLWFFYSGRTGAHASRFPHNNGGIGLATLRRDGFCSLMASNTPGYVITKPMTWPDADLLINADCRRDLTMHVVNISPSSRITVEAQTPAGEPIKGFTLADCTPYGGNSITRQGGYTPIAWGEGRSLRKLRGRKLRLKIAVADSHLYAWKAGEAPKAAATVAGKK